MDINIIIVLIYFAFLIGLGWVYRGATKNTKDYFAGGGRMQWWMVGSTAFMTSVSAMTFTGLMGKALGGGFAITTVFFANALGYFINYLIFAAKARQMRIISPMQGIRKRFGPATEQLFTWANVPLSVLQAGVWLNALSVFVSAVLHIPMTETVVITGLIVLFISLAGGSWAVITSDFLQMIVLIVMSVVAAVVAVVKAGGIGHLLAAGLPVTHPIVGDGYSHMYLFVIWFICQFTRQFFSTNNMIDSYRYITAKDTEHARKAAILACCLTLVGACVWFLPTWYVAGHYPDPSTWGISGLGNKIKDATYYVFIKREMPVGMVGLIVSAMFAATMSSMDSALNRNAGIIVKSVYEPYFAKNNTSEAKLIFVSKLMTAVFGFAIIAVAYFLISLKTYGLFDVTMIIGSLIGFPILVPSILCFFVRRTPDWSGWATVFVGMTVSAVIAYGVTPESMQHLLGLDKPLSSQEFAEMKSVTIAMIGHMVITVPFFFITRLFYKEPTGERAVERNEFFTNIDTPVVTEDTDMSIQMDNEQHQLLGKMLLAGAFALFLLVLVPNPLWGRLLFVIISAVVGGIGVILLRSVKPLSTDINAKPVKA